MVPYNTVPYFRTFFREIWLQSTAILNLCWIILSWVDLRKINTGTVPLPLPVPELIFSYYYLQFLSIFISVRMWIHMYIDGYSSRYHRTVSLDIKGWELYGMLGTVRCIEVLTHVPYPIRTIFCWWPNSCHKI